MSLGDILWDGAAFTGLYILLDQGNKRLHKYLIPWTEKTERELEKIPDPNDYSIVDKPSNYTK
jgi:hypothetical protein